MASSLVLGNDPLVSAFVAERLGYGTTFTACATIGMQRRGELIGGVVYDAYTGANCNMHVASNGSRHWMSKEFLFAAFNYPFQQLGLKRVTAPVERTNRDALRFDYHLGFEDEAVLKDAATSGDLLLLVMWSSKCRWWNGAIKEKEVA